MSDDNASAAAADDSTTAVSDEQKLDFALDLMRRMPPQTTESDLQSLIDLVPDLTESLLNAIDQPLKVARDRAVGKDYLLCDYNRDGDSYRSPWSSVYDPPFDDGIQPSERLRRLEIEANAAFEQYRELYFDGGYSSVYMWEIAGGFAGVVLIKKTSSAGGGGEWDSIHVIEVVEHKSQAKAHYKLTSTVMLTLKEEKKQLGTANIGGSLVRQKEANSAYDPAHDTSHVINIGRMVEDMENNIREALMTVYFDKTKSIVNSLRTTVDADDQSKRDSLRNELMSKMMSRSSIGH